MGSIRKTKKFLEEAKQLLRLNSVSSSGNEEVVNFLAVLMQDRHFKTQIQQVTHSSEDISKRQFNIVGIMGDPLSDRKIRKGLLLSSHLDTVGPGLYEHWTQTGGNPFFSTVKEGNIYGLGAADAKLDFLCKLYAAERFRERKLKQPIYLVGTCGKESGMLGVKYFIKSVCLNPKFVLVGGGTDLNLVIGHKSSNIFRVSISYPLVERDAKGFNRRIDLYSSGKTAHGAYPHLGTNAILISVDFLKRAIEQGFEMRFTRLDGGDGVNQVPDRAMTQFYLSPHQFEDFKRFFRELIRSERKEKVFRVELGGVGDAGVRFLPENLFSCLTEIVSFFQELEISLKTQEDDEYDLKYSTINFGTLKQKMETIDMQFEMRLFSCFSVKELFSNIQKGIQSIAAHYPNFNLSVFLECVNPGFALLPEDSSLKLCQEVLEQLQIPSSCVKQAISTEAAQYCEAGYPAVVFGPGLIQGNSHSPNEYNSLEHLEKAVDFYEKIIEKFCL